MHLLTEEAFEVYLSHLRRDGVIAILISSYHLDFEPVIRAQAAHFGLEPLRLHNGSGAGQDWGSTWMILRRRQGVVEEPADSQSAEEDGDPLPQSSLWTDDYFSLLPLLRRD